MVFKHLICPLLSLACLVWTIVLLWKQRFFMNQWLQLTNSQQAKFSGIFVIVMSLSLVAYVAARILDSNVAPHIIGDIELPFFVVWVGAFSWVAHRNSKRNSMSFLNKKNETRGSQRSWWDSWQKREVREVIISVFALVAVFVPSRRTESSVLSAIVFSAAMLFIWSGRLAEFLMIRGSYRLALLFAGIQVWAPQRSRLLRGLILLEAGLFTRATNVLEPLAFEADTKPRLHEWAYYLFATSLLQNEDQAAAQELFEAALKVPETHKSVQFGLADCLLSRGIDPERAIDLVQECLAQNFDIYTTAQKRLIVSQCIALHAWALAILRNSAESLKLLERAFAESNQMPPRELAALAHLKGVTLKALRDMKGARKEFERALRLFPHGALAIRARKGLEELNEGTAS